MSDSQCNSESCQIACHSQECSPKTILPFMAYSTIHKAASLMVSRLCLVLFHHSTEKCPIGCEWEPTAGTGAIRHLAYIKNIASLCVHVQHVVTMSWLFVCFNKSHPITWKLCVKYYYRNGLQRPFCMAAL